MINKKDSVLFGQKLREKLRSSRDRTTHPESTNLRIYESTNPEFVSQNFDQNIIFLFVLVSKF